MYAPSLEKGKKNENYYTTIYYKYFKDEVDKLNARSDKDKEEKISTKIKWIAFKHQFFSSVLIHDEAFSSGHVKYNVLSDTSRYLKKFIANATLPLNDKNKSLLSFDLYFGPNHFNTLKQYEYELPELVQLGGWILKWINRFAIIPIFNFLDNYISNYGIIILLLTIIIKIVLFPLTYRSYASMAKMKVLKPQIDEINKKIPKEKAMERQQAQMKLYRKAGVSPMGGCLPLLLQMPILIAMYRFFPSSIELRQESFLWATDLSTYDSILNLPFEIPFYGDHVSLFTILMTITTIITMRFSNQASASSSQMPGMKSMMYVMPVMLLFVLNNFSSALTYYLFLSNLITVGQNAVSKRFINEEEILKKINENKKKPQKKSNFQNKLEKMAKERGYKPPKKK
jgi:YidC/Oxa1 family membrane protein insertase